MALKIGNDGTGSSDVVKCLGYLFDPNQAYYRGVPGVLTSLTQEFSKSDGFTNLATHVAQHIGTPNFPGPKVMVPVVDFLITEAEEGYARPLQAKSAAVVIVKACLDHLAVCDIVEEFANDSVVMPKMRQVLLRAMQSEKLTTDWDEPKFWDLWSLFVLRLMDELPLAARKHGYNAYHDLIKWSVQSIREKEGLEVKGAGLAFINGLYTPTTLAGKLTYTRIVPGGHGKASGKTLTLASSIMRSQQKWWFICEADEEQPGTDRDRDYYVLKSDRDPTLNSWKKCRDRGVDPAPRVVRVGTFRLPEEHAKEVPAIKFCRWAQANDVFAKTLSDHAYSEYIFGMKKTEILFDLLSLLSFVTSEETRRLGLVVDARFEQIYEEMRARKEGTETALKLLVSSNRNDPLLATVSATIENILENIFTKHDEKYRKVCLTMIRLPFCLSTDHVCALS